jgi:hypothetical protein
MVMKIKNSPTRNPCENSLIVTPLSIDDCIYKIEEMEYFNLTVDINHQSIKRVDIYLMQRRDFDHPSYITLQLIVTGEGTCVTFHADKSPKKKSSFRTYAEQFLSLLVVLFIGVAVLQLVTTIILNSDIIVQVTLIVFLSFWMLPFKNRGNTTTETHSFDSDHMTESMLKRAEDLKISIRDTLYVDPSEARQDELGNEYYVEANVYNKRRN